LPLPRFCESMSQNIEDAGVCEGPKAEMLRHECAGNFHVRHRDPDPKLALVKE